MNEITQLERQTTSFLQALTYALLYSQAHARIYIHSDSLSVSGSYFETLGSHHYCFPKALEEDTRVFKGISYGSDDGLARFLVY